jgi:hypothetical protein
MDSGSYICYHRIITKASSSSGICKLRYIAKEEVQILWPGGWGMRYVAKENCKMDG